MAATKPQKSNDETIHVFPAKHFFVEMLTRDISLEDALLDLLDNCVDGVQRSLQGKRSDEQHPYRGYWARINFDGKSFLIEDNCGGMSEQLAKDQAFMIGRPKSVTELSAATVGMYGIGMKRSIFKMGKSARVYSQTATESFEVRIDKKWLTDDSDWDLKLKRVKKESDVRGVKIEVKDLNPAIKTAFEDVDFESTFASTIAKHYALIINKGFTVEVNGTRVKAKTLSLLFQTPKSDQDKVLAPYQYHDDQDGVIIRLAVGFYEPMPDPTQLDDEQVSKRTYHEAGWTVICNDRVVVYNDKSKLTGWGEADVPSFHNQFLGISGVVFFYTKQPLKLPLTTTKRGLETGSDLYLSVKNFMREGTKKFTSYTNSWKNFPEEEKQISAHAASKPIVELLSSAPKGVGWKSVRGSTAHRFDIPLPKPPSNTKKRIIHFSRPDEQIKSVAEYLFDHSRVEPSEVGAHCFDMILKKAEAA
ncbi:MAG: ATP-binding protein [Limisphaerales bacterium]